MLYIYVYIHAYISYTDMCFSEVYPNLLLTLKIGLFVLLLGCKSSFDILYTTNFQMQITNILSHSCLFVYLISCYVINFIVMDYFIKQD